MDGWLSTSNFHVFLEIFNRALTLMNQAVSGTIQPGAKENIAYLTSTERR